MNLSQLTRLTAIASALVLSVGCESIDIPPVSRDRRPDLPSLGFEPSDKPPVDAYDVIVYDRIDRNWRAISDAFSFPSKDYSPGKVRVAFRLQQDGTITNLKILQRTVSYRQTAACWEAVKKVKDLP